MGVVPVQLAVRETAFYVRNVRLRMPFRYGIATLRAFPILHVRVNIEGVDGTCEEGWAADCLPPKWFDKAIHKTYADDIAELVGATQAAAEIYVSLSDSYRSPFQLFLDGLEAALAVGEEKGWNHLTASFGASLMERAVIDAVGNLLHESFHALVRGNRLGISLESVHEELFAWQPRDVVRHRPLDWIAVRHTVGLADPILESDIGPEERLNDGLPQSLEAYLLTYPLRYFKVKVSGDLAVDLPRLETIAELLDITIEDAYRISLDGNEQFRSMDDFLELLEQLRSRPVFQRFYANIAFIEQPLARDVALAPDQAPAIRQLADEKPMIIDESDSDLDSFKKAVALGYRGVSLKNCKGVYKSLLNTALARYLTEHQGVQYFVTGEDLANAPIVPLHQDLATLATVGVQHAERNGYHYLHGLDHLSPAEREAALKVHPGLYTVRDGLAQLDLSRGVLDVRSLLVPGYGLGVPVDLGAMTPLEEWRFESLGATD